MKSYNELLDEAYNYGFKLVEGVNYESEADAFIDTECKIIGLSEHLQTQTEKACALAEELSHYHYNVGSILDINDCDSRRQEYKARKRMIFEHMPLSDFIGAYKAGVQSRYELAEFLCVTEKFVQEAIDIYRDHYGLYEIVDDYCIYFDPLRVAYNFDA